MKISELIKELYELKKEHGDLPVGVENLDTGDLMNILEIKEGRSTEFVTYCDVNDIKVAIESEESFLKEDELLLGGWLIEKKIRDEFNNLSENDENDLREIIDDYDRWTKERKKEEKNLPPEEIVIELKKIRDEYYEKHDIFSLNGGNSLKEDYINDMIDLNNKYGLNYLERTTKRIRDEIKKHQNKLERLNLNLKKFKTNAIIIIPDEEL